MHAYYASNACMKKRQNKIQYTIRSIPQEVNEAIRAYSAREGCSLNQAVLNVLRKGSGASDDPVIHHDLDFMAGTWIQDEKCDETLAKFDHIDEEMWK
jgi:hypothetical protein